MPALGTRRCRLPEGECQKKGEEKKKREGEEGFHVRPLFTSSQQTIPLRLKGSSFAGQNGKAAALDPMTPKSTPRGREGGSFGQASFKTLLPQEGSAITVPAESPPMTGKKKGRECNFQTSLLQPSSAREGKKKGEGERGGQETIFFLS